MAATPILSTYSVTATVTTNLLPIKRPNDVRSNWFWKVTMPSGSGANAVKIELLASANWEDTSASRVTFTANSARHWVGPVVISSQMITDAGGTLEVMFPNPAMFDLAQIKFTYSGGGTREFEFDVWVGGAA